MILSTRLRIAGLAAVLVAGSAWGQSQTPANAQAFLKAVSEAQRVLLTDLSSEALPTQRVSTVESAECGSRFIVREGTQVRGVWALNWREVRSSRLEGDRQV